MEQGEEELEMALDDIWEEAKRFFIDVSEYLNAEFKISEYEKVIRLLDGKIEKCEEQMDTIRRQLAQMQDRYISNGNTAEGHIRTDFDKKREIWYSRSEDTYGKVEDGLERAKDARAEAQSQVMYWEDIKGQEERSIRNRVFGKQQQEQKEKREKSVRK